MERGAEGGLFVSAVVEPPLLGEGWHDAEADMSADLLYSPQHKYPDLFLRFARLHRKAGPQNEDEALEMALGWIRAYGVLGVEGVDHPAYRGTRRAGRKESVAGFASEVRRAAFVLEAFEAVNSDDPERVRDCCEKHLGFTRYPVRISPEGMIASLSTHVRKTVSEYVERDCYPTLSWDPGDLKFSQGWGARSLLGAMYLQMMFYALYPGGLRICKATDCDRIVNFKAGRPSESSRKGAQGKHRTHGNKVYCSRACKQRMWDRANKKPRPS